MMSYLLLDAAPEPVPVGIGIAGLVFVAVAVLMITAAVLVGAVFLFRRIKKTSESAGRLVVGGGDLNLDSAQTQPSPQTDSTR